MTKSPLIPILIIVIAGLIYSQYLRPQYDILNLKKSNIDTLSEIIIKNQEIQSQRDVLQDRFNQITPQQVDFVENAIPKNTPVEVVKAHIDIQNLILRTRINADYAFGAIENEGDLGISVITFTGSNLTYTSARSLISSIQDWNRGSKIVEVQVTGGERGLVGIEVKVEIYFSQKSVINSELPEDFGEFGDDI